MSIAINDGDQRLARMHPRNMPSYRLQHAIYTPDNKFKNISDSRTYFCFKLIIHNVELGGGGQKKNLFE